MPEDEIIRKVSNEPAKVNSSDAKYRAKISKQIAKSRVSKHSECLSSRLPVTSSSSSAYSTSLEISTDR